MKAVQTRESGACYYRKFLDLVSRKCHFLRFFAIWANKLKCTCWWFSFPTSNIIGKAQFNGWLRKLVHTFVHRYRAAMWHRSKRPPLGCLKTKFPVWKPRLSSASTSRNTRKLSSHFSANFCLFHTFLIISSIFFPFKLLLVSFSYLPYPPSTLKQINVAWLIKWSTLHVRLYGKAWCIITQGD